MKKSDNIFIAGHKGLVGNAVYKLLKKKGFKNLITIDRKKIDLRNSILVENFFKNKKIDYMVMAAARAGGIIANSSNQKDFFLEQDLPVSPLSVTQKVCEEIYHFHPMKKIFALGGAECESYVSEDLQTSAHAERSFD